METDSLWLTGRCGFVVSSSPLPQNHLVHKGLQGITFAVSPVHNGMLGYS